MLTIFPLLTLSFISYALISLMAGGPAWVDGEVFAVFMISDDEWVVRGGDLFLMISLALLFWEIIRANNTGTESILNHAFSALLFVVCALCFVIVPNFGTSAFFMLTLMTGLDFMAGFMITTFAARRDFGVSGGISG